MMEKHQKTVKETQVLKVIEKVFSLSTEKISFLIHKQIFVSLHVEHNLKRAFDILSAKTTIAAVFIMQIKL